MFEQIICFECIDLLTNEATFVTEKISSSDGYIQPSTADINDAILAFNSESELRYEYKAIDAFVCFPTDADSGCLWSHTNE